MTGLFGPVKCSLPDVLCLLAHLGKYIIHTPLERRLAAAAGLQEGQRDPRQVGIGPRLALLNKQGSHRGCLPVIEDLQAASCCCYKLSELASAWLLRTVQGLQQRHSTVVKVQQACPTCLQCYIEAAMSTACLNGFLPHSAV